MKKYNATSPASEHAVRKGQNSNMEIHGYGCTVSWDGNELRAKGTNKFSHRALMGYDTQGFTDKELNELPAGEKLARITKMTNIADELVLTAGQFEVEKFTTGNPITNGNLTLRTTDGMKYQLHFRRKSNADFTQLANALQS